jgi:phage baseplate assembly protein W
MLGMNAQRGTSLSWVEHLKQSIINIITTPIGSRVMNRNYGSTLHLFYDQPMDGYHLAQIQAAIINALSVHEPRLKVSSVEVIPNTDPTQLGKLQINIDGVYVLTNETMAITGLAV